MSVDPVINPTTPSGGTTPSTDPVSGTPSGTSVNADIADLLRTLSSIVSAFDSNAGSVDGTDSSQNGPVLPTPQKISLNLLMSTLNTMRSNLSEAIQQSAISDISVLQALFSQYLAANPGELAALIVANTDPTTHTPQEIADFLSSLKSGTAANQPALLSLFSNFQNWLQTLNTKDNSVVANSLVLLLRLLPDTITPSISQNFADSSGASGSAALTLNIGTQTQTGVGADFFKQIVRSLFDQLMQTKILTGEGRRVNFTPGSDTPDDKTIDQLQQALLALISRAAAFSGLTALSLLKDANGAALQNPQLIDLTNSVAVLSTLLNLLRPESTAGSISGLANIAGINLAKLTPEDAAKVSVALARFLQQAIVTSGLSAFFQALKQLLAQRQSQQEVQSRITGLSTRVADLGQALNGAAITPDTLKETLEDFQTVLAGNLNTQGALTTALTGLFQESLQGGGVSNNQAVLVASGLSQKIINRFTQNTPVTADQIQNLIAQQSTLTPQQQSLLTNQVLTLAASVTTQQEVQTDLIRTGNPTAASQFSAQLSQVLFGPSVDLFTGGVTKSNASITAPSIAQIAPAVPIGPEGPIGPQGSFNRSKDVNVNLGAFLLKNMEPASVILQLASSVMYAGPQTSIAGNRNPPQSMGP